MEIDGRLRGPLHPVWATYRSLIKNAKVILNGAISVVEAEELLKDNTGDVISFGRPWLINPDFANAITAAKESQVHYNYNYDVSSRRHLSVTTNKSPQYFAQSAPGDPAKGYTDYPFVTQDYKAPQMTIE